MVCFQGPFKLSSPSFLFEFNIGGVSLGNPFPVHYNCILPDGLGQLPSHPKGLYSSRVVDFADCRTTHGSVYRAIFHLHQGLTFPSTIVVLDLHHKGSKKLPPLPNSNDMHNLR